LAAERVDGRNGGCVKMTTAEDRIGVSRGVVAGIVHYLDNRVGSWTKASMRCKEVAELGSAPRMVERPT
jgi:hypothetical protein